MYLSSKLLQAFKFKGMSKVVTLIGFNLFYINYSRRDYKDWDFIRPDEIPFLYHIEIIVNYTFAFLGLKSDKRVERTAKFIRVSAKKF